MMRLCSFAFLVLGVSGWAEPALGQSKATHDDAPTILQVVVQGLRRVDAAAATVGAKLHAGDALDADKVTQDLRTMWATGFFKDVKSYTVPQGDGVELVYVVDEKPSIRKVLFEGRDALSEDDVKGVVDVKPFTILNLELLGRNVAKLKELYLSKGYYLAQVDYAVEPVADTEVDVVFRISESDRVSVRQVSFIGNRHIDDETLRSVMQTRPGHELSWLMQSGTYKEDFVQADVFRLQALYYDQGFVAVKIGTPRATISRDRRHIYLSIPIDEGERYALGAITFAGDLDLPAQDGAPGIDEPLLRQKLSIAPHEIFNRAKLFTDIQILTDLYRDRGYAYANVTPNSHVNPESRTVDVEMEVDRGELVTIERIDVVGNVRTRDKVVRRELRIAEGDRFNQGAINLSRARVYQLGFFETVNINQHAGSHKDTMRIEIEVKEKSTGTFQVGAGFSSLESFIATAQISQNNFLGHGQSLSLSMQLSFGDFARQLASFQFFEPYFLDTPWALGVNAYLQQRYYRDFQREAKGFGPTLGYPLTHELRLSGGYTFEYVDITWSNTSAQSVLYNLFRSGRVSSVNGSLMYDSRDNRLFPSRGMFHELRAEVSSSVLGADVNMAFKRTELTLRLYQPLWWQAVFRVNLQMGWIFGSPGGSVPISERYFPGGITSVRGFAPRGLGPTLRVMGDVGDPLAGTRDFVLGGNKQAILNLEIEFPLVQSAGLKGVVFVDGGNAFNDDEGFFYIGTPASMRAPGYLIGSNRIVPTPLGLFTSFGFGVRWFSPIGPLRFEWGIPITKHAARDRDVVFEFTIGNFF
jgi:outer membrane protein insertion porin family